MRRTTRTAGADGAGPSPFDAPTLGDRSGRAGVVLSGGYSTRSGDGDEATAELAGRPLIAHDGDGNDDGADGPEPPVGRKV